MARLTRAQSLALLTSGLVLAPVPAGAQAGGPGNLVRIGSSPTDTFFEPWIALDQGFFSRAGIDAQITSFLNDALVVQGVADGNLDTGLASPVQIANGFNHGLGFQTYAGGGIYSSRLPTQAMCVAKNSPYKTAKDLEGQAIAVVVLGALTEVAVKDWFQTNGVSLSSIKIYEMPYSTMVPALQRGTVAATFLGEPFLSAAKEDVRVIGRCYDDVGSSFYISAWFSQRSWLDANASLVRRLTNVIYDTARWANTHQYETATTLARYSKLSADRIRAMNRTQFATSLESRLMSPVIDIATKYRLIDRPVSVQSLIAEGPR